MGFQRACRRKTRVKLWDEPKPKADHEVDVGPRFLRDRE
jgi:hypothetical protein